MVISVDLIFWYVVYNERRSLPQIQNVVSGMTYLPHHLAQPPLTSHLHFMEIPIPKTKVNRRGSVKVERRTYIYNSQNPARQSRPRTQQQTYPQKKRPAYQRKEPGGRPARKSEEANGMVTEAVKDGTTTTDRKKNVEEYKVRKIASVSNSNR